MRKMKKEVLFYLSIFSLVMFLNLNIKQRRSADFSLDSLLKSAMADSESGGCNSDVVCSNGLDGKPRNSKLDEVELWKRCCSESSDDRGCWGD